MLNPYFFADYSIVYVYQKNSDKDKRKLLIAMQLVSAVLLCGDAFTWGYRGSAGEQRYRKRNRSGNYPSTAIDCEKKKKFDKPKAV